MIYFTEDHEWLAIDEGKAVLGITKYAAETLGDIVFLEINETGTQLAKGDTCAVVESVKAASDIYCPMAGTIVETNKAAEEKPELLGSDPEGEGWILKMELSDAGAPDALMDRAAYDTFVANL